jgi:hypothetical protein
VSGPATVLDCVLVNLGIVSGHPGTSQKSTIGVHHEVAAERIVAKQRFR